MSSINCPFCDFEHDIGQFSDWYEHLRPGSNHMVWECVECEVEFDVTVDWEPEFYSHGDTVRCAYDPSRVYGPRLQEAREAARRDGGTP